MTHRFECPSCDFELESEDPEALLKEAKEHAEEAHDKRMPRERIEEMLEEL